MVELKRAVFKYKRRMKALEKLCLADNRAGGILNDGELDAVKASLPTWCENVKYEPGCAVCYGGLAYKCIQPHTSVSSWIPKDTPTLWEVIMPEYEGSMRDPIPAVEGLRYFKGKYYLENGVLYLCVRDDTGDGTVLHTLPSNLVDDYFKVIE